LANIHELINGCINRESRYEHAMYKYCYDLLMPICYRYTKNREEAAELLQIGFIRIMQRLEDVDISQFEPWAKSVQVNCIIDNWRKHKKEKELLSDIPADEVREDFHGINWNEAEAKLSMDELKIQIDKLPESQKLVLNLHVFEGLSHKEIAEQLGIAESSSRWHIMQARNTLKNYLSGISTRKQVNYER